MLRGGFWFATSRLIPQFYTLAISIAAARYLGPAGMGRQSYIAFLSLTLTTLVSGGLFVALLRYVGEARGRGRPEVARGLLSWAWRVEAVFALGGGALLAAAGPLGASPTSAWILAGAVTSVSVMQTVPTAVLIGAQRLRQAALVGLVTGFFGVGAIIASLAAGGGITGMFAVEAAIATINLAWTGALARGALGAAPTPIEAQDDLRRNVTRFALVSTISIALTIVVQRRSELVFLERSSTEPQVALYSIAYAVVTALLLFPNALAGSVTPAFATLFGAEAHDRIRSGFNRGLRLIVLLSLPLTAIAMALGPGLLRAIYGEQYRGTGPVLLVLVAALPMVSLVGLTESLLTGLGRWQLLLAVNAAAAAVDLGLAAALVPHFNAVGAALANTGGQLALAVPLVVFAARSPYGLDLDLGSLLRGTGASAGTGAVAWAASAGIGGPAGVTAGALLSVVSFVVLAAALRILPTRDAAWLEDAIGERFRSLPRRLCRACAPPNGLTEPKIERP